MQERYDASQRRVCETLCFNRKSVRYVAKRNPFNEALAVRIKELAAARVRYRQRRIHVSRSLQNHVVFANEVRHAVRNGCGRFA
jgi:hypothetical protein